jgi:hypothetical protein
MLIKNNPPFNDAVASFADIVRLSNQAKAQVIAQDENARRISSASEAGGRNQAWENYFQPFLSHVIKKCLRRCVFCQKDLG